MYQVDDGETASGRAVGDYGLRGGHSHMLHQYWATVQTEFGSLPGAKEVADLVETMTYEVHGARVPHFDAVISKWGNDPDVPNCPTGPALWGRGPQRQ